MVSPKVSVIVTAFKRTEFLRLALQSALAQTFQDFEIIVTDDSNNAAIREISNSYGTERIRYRTQAQTLGVALNLRAAVSEAKGTYIAVLNDDDTWEHDFLETLVRPLDEDPKRVLAFSDHWLMDGNGKVQIAETDANSKHFGRATLPEGEVEDFAGLVLLRNGVPLAMAAVFRANAIDWSKVVPEVSGAYDYWISLLLAASGGKAWYVPQRLTRYRVHAAMETSRRAPDKSEHLIYIYRTLLLDNAFPSYTWQLKQHLAGAFYAVGKDNFMFDYARAARSNLLKSLRVVFKARTLLFLFLSCCPNLVRSSAVARLQGPVNSR